MSQVRFLPALCLSLVALLHGVAARAADVMQPRPSEWAQPVEASFNLFRMSPTLYRSALPGNGAVALLKSLNVVTVISFLPEADSEWLSDPGIKQVQLPYRTNRVDDSDVLTALRTLQAAEADGPVLMHCKHGSDRTGLMAAMYRLVIQGWTKEQALKEMTEGGFGDSHHFHDSVRYVMQADVDRLREALVNGECSTSAFAMCSMKSWFDSAHVQR
ncbi:tyrosine-protein phosphatase [Pseudomonas sp. SWRI153]|uniref:Tyrosine-protein phosphatase n=1 Tax=Pseudomonas khorasanensis TaxID=2745508 RepID=A0A923F4R3_9PSED|nr:tyrosine-protein phosphatase [Pseudomonas khorasanensis]MBV4486207.1 tyrosine-protein phosphatase [Pseudomonas khorasanensis]